MCKKGEKCEKNCRLCLSNTVNARNMMEDLEFSSKLTNIFPKIEISLENGLSTFVCDFCYDFIEQFYGYFKAVNANQDELMKIQVDIQKEIIFPEAMECTESSEIEEEHDSLEKTSDTDVTEEIQDAQIGEQLNKSLNEIENTKNVLTYFDLINLPLNFTTTYLCPCPVCEEKFDTIALVQKHVFTEHMQDTPASKKLDRTKIVTKNLESECDICHERKLFKHQSGFSDHKFVHYDIKPYRCHKCHEKFHTKESLKVHIRKHIDESRRLGCFYCAKNFVAVVYRNNHVRNCHQDKMIKCDFCGQLLINKKIAKSHLKHHLIQIRHPFKCDRCVGGIKFPTARVYDLHKIRHKKEENSRKRHACTLCERHFSTEIGLLSHLENHIAGRISACRICGKSETLFEGRKLSQHAKKHLAEKKLVNKCEKCDLEFPTRVALSNHKRAAHERKELKCPNCGKICADFTWKRHLRHCSSGELPCKRCDMVFTKEPDRRRHNQEAHVGIRCLRCNVQFEKKIELMLHQKYDKDHLKTKKTKIIKKTKEN